MTPTRRVLTGRISDADLTEPKLFRKQNPDYRKRHKKAHPEVDLKASIKYLTRLSEQLDLSVPEAQYAFLAWTKTIRKIHGNQCAVCGSTHKINSHHIFYKRHYPLLSLNKNNGIPLCSIHHMELHSLNS